MKESFDFFTAVRKYFSEKGELTQKKWAKQLTEAEKEKDSSKRGVRMANVILGDTTFSENNREKVRKLLLEYSLTLPRVEKQFFQKAAENELEITNLGITPKMKMAKGW